MLTVLRLPQAAFRDLVPGRSYHGSTGVVTGTSAACGKSMLWAVFHSLFIVNVVYIVVSQ